MLSDDELPVYTVIVPVYREADVMEDLVRALDAMDYPKSKLEIKLVVERRDNETLSKILGMRLPGRYELVVAPPGEPATKPRALNIALATARGKLIVVYDAEDAPSPEPTEACRVAFRCRPRRGLPPGPAHDQKRRRFVVVEAVCGGVRGPVRSH